MPMTRPLCREVQKFTLSSLNDTVVASRPCHAANSSTALLIRGVLVASQITSSSSITAAAAASSPL